ncbi:type 1 phosphatases regulator ypi1 [Dorcoceras hygrometricum]|uniref:Type 1 phosphatases regulator ypi1 n=1 Tax=Dorcoceras hygrometricum TaxID=472368 RepID=A0A2Z7D222_9LAMI|nr:type 1 phosphatases regulator ypi1 [Dorcoceras hygrometricum]
MASATATTTTTVTLDPPSSSNQQEHPSVLVLKLKCPKKKVSWKEGTVDNEFMNKKSSKKCCIFHKEKPFDEDDSDAEGEGDCDHDHGGDEGDRNKHEQVVVN